MDLLLSRIDTEAENLLRILFGVDGLVLLVLLAVVWLVAAMLKKALQVRTRALTNNPLLLPAVNLFALGGAVSLIVRYFYRGAPLLVTFVLVLGGASMVFTFGLRARAWGVGLAQVLTSRLGIGARLELDACVGIVERIGLFQLILRTDDGERVHVPVATLDGQTFKVSSPERAYPVEYTLHLEHPAQPEDVAHAERSAQLCPYRDGSRAVTVTIDPTAPTRLVVRFRAWSEAAARRARTYLLRAR